MPVTVQRGGVGVQVISIGFLLDNEDDAVVLRGPVT